MGRLSMRILNITAPVVSPFYIRKEKESIKEEIKCQNTTLQ